MKVRELMTRGVRTCKQADSMSVAAQIMSDVDCGSVPVVDAAGRVIGMITDRDICMAAYRLARPLAEIPVSSASSGEVITVREDDTLHTAERRMHTGQVRRLPVVDPEGRPIGILSISDLARHVRELGNGIPAHIVGALAGICQPSPVHEPSAHEPSVHQGER